MPPEEPEESEEAQEASRPTGPWTPETPEQVVSALGAWSGPGRHLLRRARWLLLLSEAGLAWDTRRGRGGARRTLVLERGQVARVADADPGSPAPLPPGGPRGPLARQRSFDRSAWERLRLLTAEIRRIVAEGRAVEVRLGPRRAYDRAALARRLRWV